LTALHQIKPTSPRCPSAWQPTAGAPLIDGYAYDNETPAGIEQAAKGRSPTSPSTVSRNPSTQPGRLPPPRRQPTAIGETPQFLPCGQAGHRGIARARGWARARGSPHPVQQKSSPAFAGPEGNTEAVRKTGAARHQECRAFCYWPINGRAIRNQTSDAIFLTLTKLSSSDRLGVGRVRASIVRRVRRLRLRMGAPNWASIIASFAAQTARENGRTGLRWKRPGKRFLIETSE
jgi:hypothetical protein